MQRVPIDKAVQGMVVARPVTNETGVVMVGAGTALTEGLIEKLTALEIDHVIVKGRPLGGEAKPLDQLYKELDSRVTLIAADKVCMQIKDIIKKDLKSRSDE